MDLNGVLGKIKENFSPRRKVDFDEVDLHFELEPITSSEEIKVLEASKELEGSAYIEALKKYSLAFAIKKINDTEFPVDEITYQDGEETKIQSKFLFLSKQIEKWPTPLRDTLFEVYQNMAEEIEDKIKKMAKFERFQITPVDTEEKSEDQKFRRVNEAKKDSDVNEVNRLNKKVDEEIANANMAMAQTSQNAEDKFKR